MLLLLLKTWDGKEAPDLYELADLINTSPRQAERDLQKLIDDGEAERVPDEVKGRGHVTRFRLKESTSDVSDKTPSDVTDFITEEISASYPSDIEETTSHLTGLSDSNHVTSDVDTAKKSVTSDGTPFAPSKALRTSTDKELSLSARATRTEPKRERETRFSRETREAYAAARGLGDGWLALSRDGRYDEVVEGWQASVDTEKPTPAKRPDLTPDELQTHANTTADMLRAGDTLADIRTQIGQGISPAQWQHIASTAQAQARVRPKAAESPPVAHASNVVTMARR